MTEDEDEDSEYRDSSEHLQDSVREMAKSLRGSVGFRVRVTRDEMEKHLRARAAEHEKQAAEAEALLARVEDGVIELPETPAYTIAGLSSYAMPGVSEEEMEERRRAARLAAISTGMDRCRKKAAAFRFFADHLDDASYSLSPSEAASLEFVSDGGPQLLAGPCF